MAQKTTAGKRKRIRRTKDNGGVLLSVVWMLLILSGMLISVSYPLELQTILVADYRKEQEQQQTAEDLLQIIIHRLVNENSAFDAPGSMDFPLDVLEEMGYPDAVVELWDEGSRFNLNNTPAALWKLFVHQEQEYCQLLQTWFFQEEDLFYTGSSLARRNYLLCPEELRLVSNNEFYYSTFYPEITVFGPANFYLLDGESFLSLLRRAGETIDFSTELVIIDTFNRLRQETMYHADLATLLSQLQLPVIPDLERLNLLVTTEGTLNPNFISARYLNALFGHTADDIEKIADLKQRQAANPFPTIESFTNYLREAYGGEVSAEKIRLLFSLKTKVWGVNITTYPSDGPAFRLRAVLQRERDDDYSSWRVRVLFLQKEWL